MSHPPMVSYKVRFWPTHPHFIWHRFPKSHLKLVHDKVSKPWRNQDCERRMNVASETWLLNMANYFTLLGSTIRKKKTEHQMVDHWTIMIGVKNLQESSKKLQPSALGAGNWSWLSSGSSTASPDVRWQDHPIKPTKFRFQPEEWYGDLTSWNRLRRKIRNPA